MRTVRLFRHPGGLDGKLGRRGSRWPAKGAAARPVASELRRVSTHGGGRGWRVSGPEHRALDARRWAFD